MSARLRAPARVMAGVATALALSGAAATAQETVRFFNIFDAPATEAWKPVIAEFEKQHPEIKIELESVAGSGAAVYPDVLRTSLASGDPADVFFMWGGSIAQPFITAGQVKELSAEYQAHDWAERFPEWVMKQLTVDGKVYGVPYHARGMGLWYRKDMFAEYGIAIPTSYAELEGVCAKLKENGKYCASFGGKFGWHTMRLVDYFLEDTCGAEVHDALNARTQSWDQACVVEAFGRLKKWVDEGWLVPDFLTVAPNDARMPMYLGDAAMVYEGPWFEGVLISDQQDLANFDFFLPPTPSGRYHGFPEQWMIPVGAKNPEGAVTFIDWITKAENEKPYPLAFAGSATIGVTPDCTESPAGCKWTEILSSDTGTYPPTDQAFSKELIDSFFEAQDSVVAGRMSPEDAAKLIQQRVEASKS